MFKNIAFAIFKIAIFEIFKRSYFIEYCIDDCPVVLVYTIKVFIW